VQVEPEYARRAARNLFAACNTRTGRAVTKQARS